MINYQKLSMDLGMHLHSFGYLRSHHSRQQDIQRLRNLYSATEKKRFSGVGAIENATLNLMRNNNEMGGGSVTPRKEEKEVSSLNRSIFIN